MQRRPTQRPRPRCGVTRLTAASDTALRQARAIARVCLFAAAGWIAVSLLITALAYAALRGTLGTAVAVVLLLLAALPLVLFHRIVPPTSPTVRPAAETYGELMLAVRQVTAALGVSEPAALEFSPDCDAWLEPRPGGPVVVIGAPFLWWLRVSELRGLL